MHAAFFRVIILKGVQTLRTLNSDLGHFGVTEVSQHLGTGAEVSYGHFVTILGACLNLPSASLDFFS